VAWATDALDVVRREAWNAASGRRRIDPLTGRPGVADGAARSIKRARYALWKNPENLSEHQAAKLAWIAKTDPRLHRAYLLKEGLRHVFAVKGQDGKDALDAWTSWARRCRMPAFVELQRKIVKHQAAIDATSDHGLSNGLIESTILWSGQRGVSHVADKCVSVCRRHVLWSLSLTSTTSSVP
jgi:transposase